MRQTVDIWGTPERFANYRRWVESAGGRAVFGKDAGGRESGGTRCSSPAAGTWSPGVTGGRILPPGGWSRSGTRQNGF